MDTMEGRRIWLVSFEWSGDPLALLQVHEAKVYRSIDGTEGLAYVDGAAAPASVPVGARVARLTCTVERQGASAGQEAPWHYAVSTDVEPEAEADFNAWYDNEHLLGLAAVPGTVRAMRYLDPVGSPRYHACYDLATREAFNSPPWLAVRGTDWSSRVRPSFRNTRRTMYERVG